MNLKPLYNLCAVGALLFGAATIYAPEILVALIDPVSASVNLPNIRISLYAFLAWALLAIFWLGRVRPTAQDWPAPRPVSLGTAWLGLCVSYTGFEHGWFAFPEFVYAEDGLFETATAIILLACAIGLATVLRPALRLDRRLGMMIAFVAILCFLLLMEEISWGQRILGFETPEDIREINAQEEVNLHNMFVGFNQLIRLAISLVIATVLLTRSRWVAWLAPWGLDRMMPPPAAVYFAIFLIYAHTYDELFEEVVGLFLLVYVFDLRRRINRDA